jgi:hypothetical protein
MTPDESRPPTDLRRDVGLIVALWALSLILVNPRGDFPLNDDWSYGRAVRTLIESGIFHPTGWTSMPLIAQAWWGWLFCLPAGFSFTALRSSTLVLSVVGLLCTFLLVREASGSRRSAVLAALMLAFNPIYYALSNTFMTDVPYTAASLLVILFLLRALRAGTAADLVLGTLFAVVSVLIRQIAVVIPLAFAIVFLCTQKLRPASLVRAALPLVAAAVSLWAFESWLTSQGRLPLLYHKDSALLLDFLHRPTQYLSDAPFNAYSIVLYLGLFLSPALALVAAECWRRGTRPPLAALSGAVLIMSIAGGYYSLQRELLMPTLGNILDASGIGPLTLRDTYILNLAHGPTLPRSFWYGVTLLSLVGGTLLLAAAPVVLIRLGRRLVDRTAGFQDSPRLFLVVLVLIYLLPFALLGLIDRYLVPVIPVLTAVVIGGLPKPSDQRASDRGFGRFLPAVLLAGLAVYSIAGTHDYLAWNRARWAALHELMDNGKIGVGRIDGGFEFNGYYAYSDTADARDDKSWWWVDDDEYLLAFQEVPGYRSIRRYPYLRWMPARVDAIQVLAHPQDSRSEH